MNNNRRPTARLEAFSILEITIVIALMALLSALFFGALNRFGEQIHNETQIRNELNDWFAIRANLWRELDEADSIRVQDNRAEIFIGKELTAYRIQDDRLFRKKGESDIDMRLAMNRIELQESKGRQYVAFNIDWKNDEMILRFPLRSTVAHKVNYYFTQRQWQ